MIEVYETDNAWSVVVVAADLEKLKGPVPTQRPWLTHIVQTLFLPDRVEQDLEVARGLPPMQAQFWVCELRTIGVRASYHRWNFVPDHVLRAPYRIPGLIGQHFGFNMDHGLILNWGANFSQRPDINWKTQMGMNFQNPVITEQLDKLPEQMDYVHRLCEDLLTCFPERRFIVAYEPGCSVTFYEPDGDAPTESDSNWTNHFDQSDGRNFHLIDEFLKSAQARSSDKEADDGLRRCECGGTMTIQDAEDAKFAGVIPAFCDQCGEGWIAASRVIRLKVGAWA